MKSTYVSPRMEVYHMPASHLLSNTSFSIVDRPTGGDDGQGGYDPDNSLVKGNQSTETWDSEW